MEKKSARKTDLAKIWTLMTDSWGKLMDILDIKLKLIETDCATDWKIF